METLFNIPAVIDKKGNLLFSFSELTNAAEELKRPEERNVRILIIQDYKDATNRQLAYYHGFLVKDVVRAFHSVGEQITEVEVDKMLRRLFLFEYDTNIHTGRKVKIVKSLEKGSPTFPSTNEISMFFESVVRYTAENMSYVIFLPDDIKNIDLNFNRK